MKMRLWIFLIFGAAVCASAVPLKEAKVTVVVNDVNLLPNEAAARRASVNEDVRQGTAVRTGVESRSELTFTDQTIARLGANTIFTFDEGTRNMDLGGGAMLLRVPKNAGGAKITTAAVTAAITGTTVMLQYDPKGYAKFIVLEGTACLSVKGGDCVPVKAGQLLAVRVNPPPASLPLPVDVDLSRLVQTSVLLSNDFAPLPSLNLISAAVRQQASLKAAASANETTGNRAVADVIQASFEEMTTAVDQRTAAEALTSPSPSPSATPAPSPSVTPSPTPGPSASPSPTATVSPSPTASPSATPSPSPSPSASPSPSPSASPSPTATPSPSPSPSASPSPSPSPSPTATPIAQTIAYTGASNGHWSDPAVWLPNVVPNNAGGNYYNALIAGGLLIQDITPSVTIETLFMSGGTLRLNNPLTLQAGLQFSGGNINSGTLFIAGSSTQSAPMGASGLTINNSSDYNITLATGNVFSTAGVIFSNDGTLRKSTGTGAVNFNTSLINTGTVSVDNGTFRLNAGGTSSGIFSAAQNAILELTNGYSLVDGASISGAGTVQIANNNSTTISGNITNSGNFRVNSVGSFTDLLLGGDTGIAGNGTITLANAARVRGSGVLASTNRIQGETSNSGSLGANEIGIINQSGGVIEANVNGLALNVDPNASFGLTNNGAMLASGGGILLLNGSGGGAFTNNGTILARDASEVQLTNSASITGGTLNTEGTGVIRTLNSASLADLSNFGAFRISNNTSATFLGTITNTGTIAINSIGSFTDFLLNGNLTLTGGGSVTLENAARLRGSGVLTIGNQQLRGESSNSGSLGANEIGLILSTSNSLISADVSGLSLLVDPNPADGLTNHGVLRAIGGGILDLTGSGGGIFNNGGGQIVAFDGSEVHLRDNAVITGGELLTIGTGVIRTTNSATLDSVTNSGSFIANNNSSTTLTGTIVNTGSFLVNSTGSFTDVVINGDVTLTGGSALTLQNAARVRGSGRLFNGGANGEAFTIRGETSNSGSLGANELTIVNRAGGLIDANVNTLALVVDPGSGGLTNSGVMRASAGGVLLLTGNGGGVFDNTGGVIQALDLSQVQLAANASITGGTFSTSGSGTIHTQNSATLNSITNTGAFVANNNTSTTLLGTITNSGTMLIGSTGSFTDFFFNGNTTLTGGGTLTVQDAARVRGSGVLTIGNQTLQGDTNNSGSVGANELGIFNSVNGLVDANVSARTLVLDPNSASGLTNRGVLRASNGGILDLTGNGGGGFDNAAGQIVALDASEVHLRDGVVITGGSLSTMGSGVIRTVNSATLDSLTNSGTFIANNNTSTTLSGTITSSGSFLVNSTGSFTDIFVNGNVTLMGGSTLTLKNAARVRGSGTLFNGGSSGEAFTIQGETSNSGSLGANELALVNRSGGVIDANVNGLSFVADPGAGGLTNAGLMRATNGGVLVFTGNGGGAFNNNGGQIIAFDGSEVQFAAAAAISGGSLLSQGTGVIRVVNSAILSDLTMSANFATNNNTSTTLSGTITNNGNFAIGSTGSFTDVLLNGNVTLAGVGNMTLANADRVRGSGILTNSNNIHGETSNSGSFGTNEIGIVNASGGLIDANVNGLILNVDPSASSGLANAGTMQASNNGILLLNGNGGGNFTNSGTIRATTGGQVRMNGNVNSSGTVDIGSASMTATGNYTQTAGTFRLTGGSAQSNNALNFQGGTIDAFGNVNAAVINNATLRPALGGSGLNVTGNVSLLSASNLVFQLGGLAQGSQYGFLGVTGNVSLGGQLLVTFVNGFQNSVANSNTFTVLTSNAALTGAFSNVASNARLTTTDSAGSFLVNYNGNNIVLSDYTPQTPPPATDKPVPATKPRPVAIDVRNSNELLDLLANSGPVEGNGKVRVVAQRAAKGGSHVASPKMPMKQTQLPREVTPATARGPLPSRLAN